MLSSICLVQGQLAALCATGGIDTCQLTASAFHPGAPFKIVCLEWWTSKVVQKTATSIISHKMSFKNVHVHTQDSPRLSRGSKSQKVMHSSYVPPSLHALLGFSIRQAAQFKKLQLFWNVSITLTPALWPRTWKWPPLTDLKLKFHPHRWNQPNRAFPSLPGAV